MNDRELEQEYRSACERRGLMEGPSCRYGTYYADMSGVWENDW